MLVSVSFGTEGGAVVVAEPGRRVGQQEQLCVQPDQLRAAVHHVRGQDSHGRVRLPGVNRARRGGSLWGEAVADGRAWGERCCFREYNL